MKIETEYLTDLEFDDIDYNDYPDCVDAYVTYAWSTSLGRELTEEELDILNTEESEFVYESLMEYIF